MSDDHCSGPESSNPSDLELAERARQGDAKALNDLLEKLRPRVRQWAEAALVSKGLAALAGARFDASDVTQTTLLGVALDIGAFLGSTEPEFLAWVRRILRNDIQDIIRQHLGQGRSVRREVRLDLPPTDGAMHGDMLVSEDSTASVRAMREESKGRVWEALGALGPPASTIMRLWCFEDKSQADIAARLGLSQREVEKHVAKGKEHLRKFLEGEE